MRVDANEARDWRNCAEIAQRVLVNAREIHAGDVLNCPQQRAIAKRSNWAAKSSTSSGTSPSTGHGALHQRLEPAMHEQDAVSSQIETNLTRVFFVILAMLALLLPVSMLIQFLVAEAPAVLPAFFDQNLVSKTPLLERIEKLIPLSLILSATLIAPFLARRAQAAPATAMAFTIGAFIVLFHEAERQLAKGRWWATLMLFASICGLLLYHWRTARGATVAPANVAATGDRHWAGFNWADGVVIAFMYLILLPASFEVSAKTLNFDYHSVSYMIGPAINLRFANGLLPGVDFHAHYGLGHPFLFSYLIQPSATGTLIAFTKYLSAFNVVFYATGYLICRLFIGAQFWVALAFFVAILLNFQSDYAFIFPSNWSPRYPLLFMVAALFAVTVSSTDRKSGILAAVGLGAALGLSLFLSTETGLYFGAATALLLLVWHGRPAIVTLLAVGLSAVASFVLLCLLAFGRGVLTPEFAWRMLEPLTLYAGAFGAVDMQWQPGLRYLYNVAAQLISAATVAALIVTSRRGQDRKSSKEIAFVAAIGLIAVFMQTKFYSRSYDALWMLNALPFLIVSAWWISRLEYRSAFDRFAVERGPCLRATGVRVARIGAVVLCGLYLLFVQDSRNSTDYGLRSFAKYDSLLSTPYRLWTRGSKEWPTGDTPGPVPNAADLELIKRNLARGSRAALIHLWDWPYLIESRRASCFYFVPSVFGYWTTRSDFQRMQVLFVPAGFLKGEKIANMHPDFVALVRDEIARNYQVADKGRHLVALRRNSPPQAPTINAASPDAGKKAAPACG